MCIKKCVYWLQYTRHWWIVLRELHGPSMETGEFEAERTESRRKCIHWAPAPWSRVGHFTDRLLHAPERKGQTLRGNALHNSEHGNVFPTEAAVRLIKINEIFWWGWDYRSISQRCLTLSSYEMFHESPRHKTGNNMKKFVAFRNQ